MIINTNIINLKMPKIDRNQIKLTNIIFFNRNLDFLKIKKTEIKNMKKLNCRISGFGTLIPSRNKLIIRLKFIYIYSAIKYERNIKFIATKNNNLLPLIIFLL